MKTLGGAFPLLIILCSFSTSLFAHGDMEEFTFVASKGCAQYQKATKQQINEVQKGNELYTDFLKACVDYGVRYTWCQQLARPNPNSASVFTCTYGNLPHQLISPDSSTWEYAFKAGLMVQNLEKQNIRTEEIYNWWRPEPYNGNVGGARGRHPYGTSVDINMNSMLDTKKALQNLCRWRNEDQMTALGRYENCKTCIHLGIADIQGNTWGSPCGK